MLAFTDACENKDLEEIKDLVINNKIDVNDNERMRLCFKTAYFCSYPEAIKYLVEQGADKRLLEYKYLTSSCVYNNLDMVKYFIEECGMDPRNGAANDSLLLYAMGNVEITKYIHENNHDDLFQIWGPGYHHLYYSFDVTIEDIQYKLDQGMDINVGVETGTSLLGLLCTRFPEIEIIKYIVERGAKVNIYMEHGISLLRILFDFGYQQYYKKDYTDMIKKYEILKYLLYQEHDKLDPEHIKAGLKYCSDIGYKDAIEIYLDYDIELHEHIFYKRHRKQYKKAVDKLKSEYHEIQNTLNEYIPNEISNILISDIIGLYHREIIYDILRL